MVINNRQNKILRIFYLVVFSFRHLVSALHRFESGHKSSGVWLFLFFTVRSEPLAAKKQAMEADDLVYAPLLPRPISSFPTSCISYEGIWNQVVNCVIATQWTLFDFLNIFWVLPATVWAVREYDA